MEFSCRLGTESGAVIEEVHVAESESKLRQELEVKGMYLLSVSRRGAFGWSGFSLPRRRRIKTREFLVFNQELATLLRAGLPLVQSLDILRQRVEDASFKAVLDDVHDRVRAGAALSEAFEAQEMIPGMYTATLLAGEKSGGLEEVIRRYVDYVKVVAAVKRKTVSALVYPLILLTLSTIVVAIIVLRVVPEFEGFYQGFGAGAADRDPDDRRRLPVPPNLHAGPGAGCRRGGRRRRVLAATTWHRGPAGQADPPRAAGRHDRRGGLPRRSSRVRWGRCLAVGSPWSTPSMSRRARWETGSSPTS